MPDDDHEIPDTAEGRIRAYLAAMEKHNTNPVGPHYGDVVHGLNFDRLTMTDLRAMLDTMDAIRAEATKMFKEHGQSWNSMSGRRILRAMGEEPVDRPREPDYGPPAEFYDGGDD